MRVCNRWKGGQAGQLLWHRAWWRSGSKVRTLFHCRGDGRPPETMACSSGESRQMQCSRRDIQGAATVSP